MDRQAGWVLCCSWLGSDFGSCRRLSSCLSPCRRRRRDPASRLSLWPPHSLRPGCLGPASLPLSFKPTTPEATHTHRRPSSVLPRRADGAEKVERSRPAQAAETEREESDANRHPQRRDTHPFNQEASIQTFSVVIGHMPKKTGLYVSHTEHSGALGKHGPNSGKIGQHTGPQLARVPFTCCAISLQPWVNPVADKADGTVFELTNVIPWIKKHGTSPASGNELKASDLITLKFARKDDNGSWHDPVSYKTFTDSTHLVAIIPSGNVFAYETVQQLNIKAKYWADLLTGESFARQDILTLQDPNDTTPKQVSDLRNTAQELGRLQNDNDTDEVNIAATGSAGALLRKLKESKTADQDSRKQAAAAAERTMRAAAAQSSASTSRASASLMSKPPDVSSGIGTGRATGMTAASFTSTGLDLRTKTERETVSQEEVMYDTVRQNAKGKGPAKGYVRLVSNFGPLNLELHCDKAPKTCYNFLTLCRRGEYTDTILHRNIPGFMVQGGDPTGTGRGGNSMWGQPFGDELAAPGAYRHTGRGDLSMANRGPDTNGSQFFITYAAKPHLDKKHTVFGRLIDLPSDTLDAIEKVPTEAGTDRPLRTVRILDVQIFSDPFEEYQERERKRLSRSDESEVIKREEKRRKRDEDRTTWLGTSLGVRDAQAQRAQPNSSGDAVGVGRYLQPPQVASRQGSTTVGDGLGTQLPGVREKRRGGEGARTFGDFSHW